MPLCNLLDESLDTKDTKKKDSHLNFAVCGFCKTVVTPKKVFPRRWIQPVWLHGPRCAEMRLQALRLSQDAFLRGAAAVPRLYPGCIQAVAGCAKGVATRRRALRALRRPWYLDSSAGGQRTAPRNRLDPGSGKCPPEGCPNTYQPRPTPCLPEHGVSPQAGRLEPLVLKKRSAMTCGVVPPSPAAWPRADARTNMGRATTTRRLPRILRLNSAHTPIRVAAMRVQTLRAQPWRLLGTLNARRGQPSSQPGSGRWLATAGYKWIQTWIQNVCCSKIARKA